MSEDTGAQALAASAGHGPAVSVIIPCFNAAGFVRDAIDSVLSQGRYRTQIIIVNDGSPDASELRLALASYGDQIVLIEQPHRGLAAARNAGLAAAAGEFVAFLDADDVWKSGFLDVQLSVLRRRSADLVYGDAEMFGSERLAGTRFMDLFPSSGEVTAAALLLKRCVVVMSTIVVRTEAVREAGGFDERLTHCEDLDLWVRMVMAGMSFTYERAVRARRRIHDGNMSNDHNGMIQGSICVIDRYAQSVQLSRAERRFLAARRRRLGATLYENRAKEAIGAGNTGEARSYQWRAFSEDKTAWRLLKGIGLSLLPRAWWSLVRGLSRLRRR